MTATILDVLAEWNDNQNNLPGNQSQDDATDTLQIYAPTVDDATGDAWWVALSVAMGDDWGVINPSTYVGLRNYVNNNQVVADNLFTALIQGINDIPESAFINQEITRQNLTIEQSTIPGNIATLEATKDGTAQLDTALDVAIASLQRRDDQITQALENL